MAPVKPMATLVISLKNGKENPDKASLALVVALSAVVSSQETVLYLSAEGVRLAEPGYVAGVHERRFLPLATLLDNFVEGGGAVWVCAGSLRKRGLAPHDLIAAAIVVEESALVRLLAHGATCFTY